jgi:RNA polymerase sigma factor (sigma-70 family)
MKRQEPCNEWEDLLALRLEDLSSADRVSLEAHLSVCPACAAISDHYRRVQVSLAAFPTPTMEPIPYAWKRENKHKVREEAQQENSEDILMRYDGYIRTLVMRYVSQISLPAGLEKVVIVDELVQETRIRFFHALEQTRIEHPQAYISHIVRSVCIDLVRRNRKPIFTLDQTAEVVEVSHPSPANAEQQEERDIIDQAVAAILTLPQKQKQAMLCSLKEQLDDTSLIAEALLRYNINIRNINWPEEVQEKQRLRSSLVVARKKLRQVFSQQPGREDLLEKVEARSMSQIEALFGSA